MCGTCPRRRRRDLALQSIQQTFDLDCAVPVVLFSSIDIARVLHQGDWTRFLWKQLAQIAFKFLPTPGIVWSSSSLCEFHRSRLLVVAVGHFFVRDLLLFIFLCACWSLNKTSNHARPSFLFGLHFCTRPYFFLKALLELWCRRRQANIVGATSKVVA